PPYLVLRAAAMSPARSVQDLPVLQEGNRLWMADVKRVLRLAIDGRAVLDSVELGYGREVRSVRSTSHQGLCRIHGIHRSKPAASDESRRVPLQERGSKFHRLVLHYRRIREERLQRTAAPKD